MKLSLCALGVCTYQGMAFLSFLSEGSLTWYFQSLYRNGLVGRGEDAPETYTYVKLDCTYQLIHRSIHYPSRSSLCG